MAALAKVFISHSSAQDKLASEIADFIGRDKVCLDVFNFEKGAEIIKEIEEKIDKSSIFLLLLSDEALNSDWVKKEINIIRLKLLDEEIADFVPVLVDDKIQVEDARFEEKPFKWMLKYLLKKVLSPKMVARLVMRKLNQQRLDYDKIAREKERLFFGRDKDISELKIRLFEDTTNSKRAIIVSGLDHVGRKRLLKEFILQTVSDVHDAYIPIKIILTESDGIERLISQLNEYLQLYSDDNLLDLLNDSQTAMNTAVEMLNKIAESQERITIRDEKCIVLGNGKLTNWFITLLMRKDLFPMIHFFVASKFTPRSGVENSFPCIISRQIAALDRINMKALFNAYAKNRNLSLDEKETIFFLDHMSGFPKQAYVAIDLLEVDGYKMAEKHISQVTDMFNGNFLEIISELDKIPHAKDILVLFSMFEFISGDLLTQVCPDNIDEALEEFRKYSLYETFGSSNQYLRLNAGIADYISRNKIELPAHYMARLRGITRDLLADMDSSLTDLSSQLLAIKETLRDPVARSRAKEKYLLPPFVLKVIVEEYNKKEDGNVIQLVEMLLNDKVRNGYDEINRSIHYWYCCSLCRTKNRKFYQQVEFFRDSLYSYYFLKGFFERHQKHYNDAEEYYRKALDLSRADGDREYVSKAEHELVMVLTELGNYTEAYDLAKKSFERDKSNPYHIEAYFRCIANSSHPDRNLMKELIDRMELTYANNKSELVPSMKAQYYYYVGKDFGQAVSKLSDVIAAEGKETYKYARRALREICSHSDSMQTYNSVLRQLGKKR
jgi:tetratricopeptide (TPR) repeat protein